MLWLACNQAIFVFLPQLHMNLPLLSCAIHNYPGGTEQSYYLYLRIIYIWGVVESPDKSVAWPAPPCFSSIFPDQSSAETHATLVFTLILDA